MKLRGKEGMKEVYYSERFLSAPVKLTNQKRDILKTRKKDIKSSRETVQRGGFEGKRELKEAYCNERFLSLSLGRLN